MHNLLPEVEKVCSMLVQKKLIYSKNDEVGMILFGTEETKNDLTNEVGGYDHVMVFQDVRVVDGQMVDALQKLRRGTVPGDFLDAIVVGMDMLIKKYGQTNKGKKRLCLITNAQSPIKEPYEGTKADQVSIMAAQMDGHGMKMDSVVLRGKLGGPSNEKVVRENDALLSLFSEKTRAKIVSVESAISLLGSLRTRNISPVTIYRGNLEIGPHLKIKVWVYKKTSEEKFPTLKKYSDKAPPSDKFATHEIKLDYEYKSVQDPNRVVPPDQRIKGFRYGPEVIPISPAEWDAVKYKPEKSVKLLGFTDSKNIMRHYYMKDVSIFIPEPGNTKAILAVSALARAMNESNKVAILRCVWRQGQNNVVIGVLTPNISNKSSIPDSFFFNVLPFAEDVREFQFPSFSNLPSAYQPSQEQQEAADDFVRMLDLTSPGKEEVLVPDVTPNPVLERFYRYLELKSKNPDAPVPPLDATLKKITEPDQEILSENQKAIDGFRKHFELKENPKLKKSHKRLMRGRSSGSNDNEEGLGYIKNSPSASSADPVLLIKSGGIGDAAPVEDFEAMMSRRDSPEWVEKAIMDMKNKIFDLVEDSYEGDSYPKALECLQALRKGCILEQEPKQFNDFLQNLCRFCQEKDLKSFCDLLVSKGVLLITKTEAADRRRHASWSKLRRKIHEDCVRLCDCEAHYDFSCQFLVKMCARRRVLIFVRLMDSSSHTSWRSHFGQLVSL
ncbi:unnamed protein product [Rhodiola kirilowii]